MIMFGYLKFNLRRKILFIDATCISNEFESLVEMLIPKTSVDLISVVTDC